MVADEIADAFRHTFIRVPFCGLSTGNQNHLVGESQYSAVPPFACVEF